MPKYFDSPIGSVVLYKEVRLQVEEVTDFNNACTGCYFKPKNRPKIGFHGDGCYKHNLLCTAFQRRDNKSVFFRKID